MLRGICRRVDTISSKTIDIGKAAGVKVDEREDKSGNRRTVWESAHDLRREFGTRMSRLVTSSVLKELMRHESIQTTEKYYIDANADDPARMLAQVFGQTGSKVATEVALTATE